jgi:arginase
MPTDAQSSYLRGAAAAPAAIRAALASDHWNRMSETGFDLYKDIPVEDAGDLTLTGAETDDAIIREAVSQAATDGAVPFSLGGDHAITAPIAAGLASVHGPLNILHIDAHPDLYEVYENNPRSHASPFARIMEAGSARRLVQVGIRTLNPHQRQQANRYGVEIFEMMNFDLEAVPSLVGNVYVTIDLDGLDPAFAPGVSHHEPGGLSVREVITLIHRIAGRLVGADIVELNPARDINGMTATVCAKLIKELAGIAARSG